MPPTTTTRRGSGLTRSEAAILAWKKRPRAKPKQGGLDPKIAARVKQILAEKQKKTAPKAKGKGKAKPKADGRTPQEKANQNRAAVAKQGGMDKLEGVMVRLGAGMASDQEKDAHEDLIKKGLATRGADGKAKLTSAGKKWKAAADKGNAEGAGAALAEGRGAASEGAAKEKAKAEKGAAREKVKAERAAAQEAKKQARAKTVAEKKKKAEGKQKGMERARKKSKSRKEPKADDTDERTAAAIDKWRKIREVQRIGKAIDMEIKAGARHSKTDMQHLQGIHDSAVACGASCGAEEGAPDDTDDEEEGVKAIKGIMDNPQWYAQHECGDIMQASGALSTLAMLIQSELSEEDEDDAQITQLCDAARTLITFIGEELDHLEGAASDAASATIGYEPMKAARIADLSKGAAPTHDDFAAPMEIVTSGTAKSGSYSHIDGSAVKALDDDTIGGYAVLFGSADKPDLERDFYTKSTNFWLDDFGWPRPITYHHGMDAGTRDNPVIGHWTKAAVDDTGVWLTGQLDKAHAYYSAIKQLAERGYLKLSSDSAPQWVQRERQTNGANFVKRWPLVTASCTVTPMEPRMLPVEVKAFLAEIGYEALHTDNQEAQDPSGDRPDEAKAVDERARALSLELDLIALETIE